MNNAVPTLIVVVPTQYSLIKVQPLQWLLMQMLEPAKVPSVFYELNSSVSKCANRLFKHRRYRWRGRQMYSNQSSIIVGDTATDRMANVAIAGASTYATAFAAVQATGTTYTANSSAGIAQTQTASTSAVAAADGTIAVEAVTQKDLMFPVKVRQIWPLPPSTMLWKRKSSAERSKLGAMQNRLEHTIKNLDTSSKNLQHQKLESET